MAKASHNHDSRRVFRQDITSNPRGQFAIVTRGSLRHSQVRSTPLRRHLHQSLQPPRTRSQAQRRSRHGVSSFLNHVTVVDEVSEDTYKIDTNDVPLLNEGINSTARYMFLDQSIVEDEGKSWDEGVLEDFKRQRDGLVSMRDMFDRRERLAKDNIPQLERRIQGNESKLAGIRSNPDQQRNSGEAEKVEDAIMKVC